MLLPPVTDIFESGNFPQAFPSGIIVCDNQVISIFLRVGTKGNKGENAGFLIHLVFNGDMKADSNGSMEPAWLHRQSAFSFPEDLVADGRQHNRVSKVYREPV